MRRPPPQQEEVMKLKKRVGRGTTFGAIAMALALSLKCLVPLLVGGIAPIITGVIEFKGSLAAALVGGVVLTAVRYGLLYLVFRVRAAGKEGKPGDITSIIDDVNYSQKMDGQTSWDAKQMTELIVTKKPDRLPGAKFARPKEGKVLILAAHSRS